MPPVIPQPLYVPGSGQRDVSQQLLYALVSQVPNLALGLMREMRTRREEGRLEEERQMQGEAELASLIPMLQGAQSAGGMAAQTAQGLAQQFGMGMAPPVPFQQPQAQPQPQMPQGMTQSVAAAPQQPQMGAAGGVAMRGAMTPDMARVAAPVMRRAIGDAMQFQASEEAIKTEQQRRELAVSADKRDQIRLGLAEASDRREQAEHLARMEEIEYRKTHIRPLELARAQQELKTAALDYELKVEHGAMQTFLLYKEQEQDFFRTLVGSSGMGANQASVMDALQRSGELYLQGKGFEDFRRLYSDYYIEKVLTEDEFLKELKPDLIRQTGALIGSAPDFVQALSAELQKGPRSANQIYGQLTRENHQAFLNGEYRELAKENGIEPRTIWAQKQTEYHSLFNAWGMQKALAEGRTYTPMKLQQPTEQELRDALKQHSGEWLGKLAGIQPTRPQLGGGGAPNAAQSLLQRIPLGGGSTVGSVGPMLTHELRRMMPTGQQVTQGALGIANAADPRNVVNRGLFGGSQQPSHSVLFGPQSQPDFATRYLDFTRGISSNATNR